MKYKITEKWTQERIDEILKIKKENGLTAENMVEKAKNKSSQLHDLFEWEDSIAAEKWRLQQARVLVNEVKVIVDTKEYYAFENVSVKVESSENENSRQYKDRVEILTDEELRKQVVKTAYNQLLYWKEKYASYKEFNIVTKAIEKMEKKWRGKK